MTHNKITTFALYVILAMTVVSCSSDPESPGRTFMPGMTYSPAYETYADSTAVREPVAGTISRGTLPSADKGDTTGKAEAAQLSYMYKAYSDNTDSSYQLSGSLLSNPLAPTKQVLAIGKRMYNINCAICHGEKGNGDGTIITNNSYPGVPPNFDTKLQEINEGTIFHVITYGKGLMGGYSSHLDVNERWAVVYYIQKMAKAGSFAAGAAPAEEEAVADEAATEGEAETVVEEETEG